MHSSKRRWDATEDDRLLTLMQPAKHTFRSVTCLFPGRYYLAACHRHHIISVFRQASLPERNKLRP